MTYRHIFTSAVAVYATIYCTTSNAARPILPKELNDNVEYISFVSIGWGESGTFGVGPYAGEFKRRLNTRTNKFGGLISFGSERQSGKTKYALSGGDLRTPISGDCQMNQVERSIAGFSVETQPFSLQCTLGADGASMSLDTVPHANSFRQDRVGTVRFNDIVIEVRSIHKAQKGGTTAEPLGYVFTRNGLAVAAVDVSGKAHVVFAKSLDQPTRQILLSAATGLALVWTPQI